MNLARCRVWTAKLFARPHFLLLTALVSLLSACSLNPSLEEAAGSADSHRAARSRVLPEASKAELYVLATTDLHGHVKSYDYFRLEEDPSIGLERLATLIRAQQATLPNTVLFDNGDTIQGSALADYEGQVRPPDCRTGSTTYRAMESLGYDAGTVGNHDFNFGLSFLAQITGRRFHVDRHEREAPMPTEDCRGPRFPLVLANVVSTRDGQTLFPPYIILERTISAQDASGRPLKLPLKVGVIGFTPPKIMQWDRRWLEGRVRVIGVKEAAERYVPEMRSRGADVIIALSHGGLDASPYRPEMENASWHLAQVPGLDVLIMGHSHQSFPNSSNQAPPSFRAPGVDPERGFVHGIPAVMPSFWGRALGLIQLPLTVKQGRWTVERKASQVRLLPIMGADKQTVASDPEIHAIAAEAHQATLDYLRTPIGTSDYTMSTYFADVGDVSALEIVNRAQTAYIRELIQREYPELAHLPVLSMAAPFKTGFAGPHDYVHVPAGPLSIHRAADLYLYANTLQAVRIHGALLKSWLETAARRFRTIDPSLQSPQMLIANHPGFNFDMLTDPDVRYLIDVTAPEGSRIRDLRYRGRPISDTDEFIVATNNYRASGGGGFPGLDGTRTVIDTGSTNREILIAFIRAQGHLRATKPAGERSWRFFPVRTAGPILFTSAPGKLELLQAQGLTHISEYQPDDATGRGFALYRIELDMDRW